MSRQALINIAIAVLFLAGVAVVVFAFFTTDQMNEPATKAPDTLQTQTPREPTTSNVPPAGSPR